MSDRDHAAQEIDHVCGQALTVKQLREALEDMDDDAPVLFACSYGDYHDTLQALPVGEPEEFTRGDLFDSAYSQSGIAMVKDDCPEDHDEPVVDHEDDDMPVVVIRL